MLRTSTALITAQPGHQVGRLGVVVVERATNRDYQVGLELGGFPRVPIQTSLQGGDNRRVELNPLASVQLGKCVLDGAGVTLKP